MNKFAALSALAVVVAGSLASSAGSAEAGQRYGYRGGHQGQVKHDRVYRSHGDRGYNHAGAAVAASVVGGIVGGLIAAQAQPSYNSDYTTAYGYAQPTYGYAQPVYYERRVVRPARPFYYEPPIVQRRVVHYGYEHGYGSRRSHQPSYGHDYGNVGYGYRYDHGSYYR